MMPYPARGVGSPETMSLHACAWTAPAKSPTSDPAAVPAGCIPPDGSTEYPVQLAHLAAAEGIVIHTIGLGNLVDVDLMRDNPPLAPFMHPQSRIVVSPSVGCVVLHPIITFDITALCKKP